MATAIRLVSVVSCHCTRADRKYVLPSQALRHCSRFAFTIIRLGHESSLFHNMARQHLKKNYMAFVFASPRHKQFGLQTWSKYAKPSYIARFGTASDCKNLAKRRQDSGSVGSTLRQRRRRSPRLSPVAPPWQDVTCEVLAHIAFFTLLRGDTCRCGTLQCGHNGCTASCTVA